MLRSRRARRAIGAGLMLVASLGLSACPYKARGSLPDHIQTVRVQMFRNDTEYVDLEGPMTRALIEKLVRDPAVQVVQHGEDALFTGEIEEVQKRVLRSDRDDRPTSIRLTIVLRVTFEDKVTGRKILDRARIRSSSASSAAGVYDLERGESRSLAEAQAIDELADLIVRRTVGMWETPPVPPAPADEGGEPEQAAPARSESEQPQA